MSLMHGKGNAKTAKSDLSIEHDFTCATGTGAKGSNLKRRKSSVKAVNTAEHTLPKTNASSPSFCSGLVNEIWAILLTLWRMNWELLISFSPFLIVLMAFLLFVYWNGSIVLGAKEAHAVTPHFAQILYFSLVSVLAQAPMHFTFTHAVDLFQSFWRSRPLSYILMFLALIAGIFSVHFFRLHQTLITCLTSKQNLHFDFSIMKCIFW